jgi:2-oxoglutarate dehydrogenase E2 component (dihydrolipoamide succinyltransferase)
MAIVEVKVPQLSESVAEATMLQWKKKVGDTVAADEILIEIETDKVVLEVPAPAAGVLSEIIQGDGATVAAEQLIARIDTDGKVAAAAPAAAAGCAAPAAPVAAAGCSAPAAAAGCSAPTAPVAAVAGCAAPAAAAAGCSAPAAPPWASAAGAVANFPFVGGVIIWSLIGIFARHRMNLPDFGITGVANMALFGIILSVLMVLLTLRKKNNRIIIKY